MTKLQLHVFQTAAKILIAEHLGPKWRLLWTYSVSTFGYCNSTDREIEISKPLAAADTVAEAMDTLGHEIAHALIGGAERAEHGPKWIAMAKRMRVRCEWNDADDVRSAKIKARAKRARARRRRARDQK